MNLSRFQVANTSRVAFIWQLKVDSHGGSGQYVSNPLGIRKFPWAQEALEGLPTPERTPGRSDEPTKSSPSGKDANPWPPRTSAFCNGMVFCTVTYIAVPTYVPECSHTSDETVHDIAVVIYCDLEQCI